MRASVYSIKKTTQNDIDYLSIDLKEGLSGESFSFRLKDGHPISDDFLENFEASYVAWQSMDTDARMPWSPSLVSGLTTQVDKFNNYQNYIADIHVQDIMSETPKTFAPDTPVVEAAQAVIDLKISGAPVVDENEVLIGIVSEKDILSSLFEETSSGGSKLAKSGSLEIKTMTQPISNIMITDVLSVDLDDEITYLLRIMQDNNLRRLPVVKDSKLIGMVSIGDIHRAIFKSCLK